MAREWLPIAQSIQQRPSLRSMIVNWYERREVGAHQSLVCWEHSNWEGKSFPLRNRRVADVESYQHLWRSLSGPDIIKLVLGHFRGFLLSVEEESKGETQCCRHRSNSNASNGTRRKTGNEMTNGKKNTIPQLTATGIVTVSLGKVTKARNRSMVAYLGKVIGMGKGDSILVEWKDSRPIVLGHTSTVQPNGERCIKVNWNAMRLPYVKMNDIGVRRVSPSQVLVLET
ncbi:hypothetical protein F5141DRAFT_1061314 [Pisolithus sp. B1]|nr:hypothetical protein F5141DRAFT_1061314 [Pisolithus sp. B1]